MSTLRLQDNQWTKIRDSLQANPKAYIGKNEEECRRFVEGILWMSRSGAQWRLLPTEYGKWNSVYKRFTRWCDQGVWEQMLSHFAADPDMENGLIDSTVVRAHPYAAGAPKNGGQEAQALGRSRGGFSTKIHGLGNPLRFCLTAGQDADMGQAVFLVEALAFDRLIADRAYAAQDFFDWIVNQEMEAVIPPHPRAKGEKAQRPYDRWLYRERHLVGCFINKIKHYRRIFSRFEKLAGRYLGFLQFVSSLIWLR